MSFENADWPEKAYEAFQKYDVVSLASSVRYEEELDYTRKTIGYNVVEGKYDGHVGFTLGMTRKAYDRYGGFEAFALHDDMWIWHSILGTDNYPSRRGWTPYRTGDGMKHGLPFNVGYADSSAVHLYHGASDRDRYELFGYAQYLTNQKPFDDIEYDRTTPDTLPKWSGSASGRVVKRAFELIRNGDVPQYVQREQARTLAVAFLEQARLELFGKPDAPIIMTAYREDQSRRGIEPVLEFKKALEEKCRQEFVFVVVTDAFTTEEAAQYGLDAVPFSRKYVAEDMRLWPAERFSPIIDFPDKSVRTWIDFGDVPERSFYVCGDGFTYLK